MTAKHSNPTCNRNVEHDSVEEISQITEFERISGNSIGKKFKLGVPVAKH